jgi:hypothetical protein
LVDDVGVGIVVVREGEGEPGVVAAAWRQPFSSHLAREHGVAAPVAEHEAAPAKLKYAHARERVKSIAQYDLSNAKPSQEYFNSAKHENT